MASLKQPWDTAPLDPGTDPYAIDDGSASGGYTPPADTSTPTAKPVASAPGPGTSTPDPWMDQAATSAPSSYAAPAAPQNVQDMVSGWIKNNNLTANQNDPNSLHSITQYLHQNGINAQVDYTDANGHTGGILIDGKPYQLINGQNQWTPLQPWEQGGGGNGAGLPNPPSIPQPNYDLGVAPTWNPGVATPPGSSDFTKMLQDSYGKMIQSNQDTIDNPMSSAQFEALRQPIDKARRTALNSATGALAARGTLQGSGELANYGSRLEGELGPDFATAVQNASVANQNAARTSQASTLAGGSQLSGITGDLALRNLDQNRLWNQFLGTYGLDRARVQAMIDQGYGDQILKLFEIQANGAI